MNPPSARPALVAVADGREQSGASAYGAAVAVIAPPDVAAVLATLGRTEDLVLAPDGQHLAIAGFLANSIAIVRFSEAFDPQRQLDIERVVLLRAVGLVNPHGLGYLDAHTLVVANRSAELLLLELPDDIDAACSHASFDGACGRVGGLTVAGHVLLDGAAPVPVRTPGSVAVRPLAPGVAELLVCNNYVHEVTRHVVARTTPGVSGWAVVESDVLLRAELDVPDGIAVSPDGMWLAVSNHESHEVFTYRLDEALGPDSSPHGRLRGADYPHGLRFSADGTRLFLADAGLPYLHEYAATEGDWSGPREPSVTVRVMDDAVFRRGRTNTQEGGPKGLALLPSGAAVVTSDQQSLGCFDVCQGGAARGPAAVLAPPDPAADVVARFAARVATAESAAADARATAAAAVADAAAARAEAAAARVAREQARAEVAEVAAMATDLRARVDAQQAALAGSVARAAAEDAVRAAEVDAATRIAAVEADLAALRASTAWRVTRPARAVADRVRRRRC